MSWPAEDDATVSRKVIPHPGAGRKIAEDSRHELLSEYDQMFFRSKSVQVRVPLRDPREAKHHLRMMLEAAHDLIAVIDRLGDKDRTALLVIRERLHQLDRKINAKRRQGHDLVVRKADEKW